MRKIILIAVILAVGLTSFAQENPPLVNISQFIYGGTPDVGESKMIGRIYDSERKHILLTVYCRNYKDDYGWLYTPYIIYTYDDANEHITIPVRSEYTYHGYTVWYRTADLQIPDNVRKINFEPSYLYKVSLTIGKNSKIEEVHIPKSVTNLTIKVAKEYQGDVVFFMESDNPQFKDGFFQSYYEPDYKKCVFIVPKGSIERYKSIGRFQYARIYESIEEYRYSKTSGNNNISNYQNSNYSSTRSTSEMSDEYVDLGLPSCTLWKNQNENGLYAYDDALSFWGDKMATNEQWNELFHNCKWTKKSYGYEVKGPNGNAIFLTADGCRECDDKEGRTGGGYYWTATSTSDDSAIGLFFYYNSLFRNPSKKCNRYSIRLVMTR